MTQTVSKIKSILGVRSKSFIKRNLPSFFWLRFSKEKLIDNYIKKYHLDIFIETGTFKGDTLFRLKDKFRDLYSVELSEHYYKLAEERFENISNVHLIYGDSGEKIRDLVKSIDKPIFFWLDGHYSAGLTAKADVDTPIMKELEIIFENNQNNYKHVILIDDARLFNGTQDYPTFKYLKKYIKSKDLRYSVFIKNDVIVCVIK